MTGKAILEAMSFVDEGYIEEAERAVLPAMRPAIKWIPLAACLGIALLGLYFTDHSADNESAADREGIQMQQEIEMETHFKEEHSTSDAREDIADEVMQPNISEAPSIIVRIASWEENGFIATVEQHVDSAAIPIGQTVRVQLQPETSLDTESADPAQAVREMPEQEEFPVGTLVQVRYVLIYGDTGVILAEAVELAGDE